MRNVKRFLAIFLVSLLVLTIFSPFSTTVRARNNSTNIVSPAKAEESFLEKTKNSTDYFDIIIELKDTPLAKYYNKSNKSYSIMSGVTKGISNISKGFDMSQIATQQKKFYDFADSELSNYTVLAPPTSIAFNGVFLRVKGNEISKLVESSLVAYIYPSSTYQPSDDYSEKAIGMGASASSEINLSGTSDGTGLKFGIIDTGVDYTHPDLGGGTKGVFPDPANTKVAGGYDFADNDADPYPDIVSYGHGTHVAGIMAADGVIKGIAPKATIYAYKVFSSKDGKAGATDITIILAIERAIKDGCDVINMSLGSGDGTALNPETEAINNATMAGIIVVVAAGNAGPKIPQDEFPIGTPSTTLNAISVAATNDGPYTNVKIVSPEGDATVIEGGQFDVSPAYENGKTFSIVDCGYGSVAEVQAAEIAGKIALIERGPIGDGALYYRDKVLNAMKAGAVGTIIYNHSPGDISATLIVDATTDAGREFIPSISVTQGNGLYLKNLSKNGLMVEMVANSNKGTIAEFSSMGITSDFEFKPDVSAPGENIYSTYMGTTNKYATLSGTSMAAPCVAAVTGLLKKAHSNWTPEDIRLALANTSTVLTNPVNNEIISWTLQGAGRINVPAAFNTDTFIYTTKTDSSFKASGMLGKFIDNGTFEQKVLVNNISANTKNYNVSFNWTSKYNEGVNSILSASTLTVDANSTASFNVSFSNKSKKNTSYEGIINVTGGKETLHIPVILWEGEVKINKQVDNVTIEKNVFNPAGGKTDKISFSLGYGGVIVYNGEYSASNLVPSTVIRVYDNTGIKLLGTIFSKEMLFMGDYEFDWDGRDTNGNWFLKDGDYKIRVSTLEGNNDTKNLQIVEKDSETVSVKITGALDSTAFIYPKITGTPKTGWFTVINVDIASKISLNEISGEIALDKNLLKYDEVVSGDLTNNNSGVRLTTSYEETTGILKFGVTGKIMGEGTLLSIRVNIVGSGTINAAIDSMKIKDVSEIAIPYGSNSESVNIVMATKDWDVNGDRVIDIKDLLTVAKACGYSIGNSNYCPEADINKDGKVDETDLAKINEYFGQVYP